jgi:hypothetical protein
MKRAIEGVLAGALIAATVVAVRWGLRVRRIHREWQTGNHTER